MNSKLVKIGNSRGVRLPAVTLEECGFEENINIDVVNKSFIIIKPVKKNVREGWKDKLKKMHEKKEDTPYVNDSLDISKLDDFEW